MTELLNTESVGILLNNKYAKYYKTIINNALTRTCKEGVFERHHILPRSLGGSNRNDNLVLLTPREHYICHLLLTKVVTGKIRSKMIRAVVMMGGKQKKSRAYETLRVEYVKSKIGIPLSDSHRKNISESNKGIQHNPWTKEMRARASLRLKGRKRPYLVGRTISEETRAKIGAKSKEYWAKRRAATLGINPSQPF